MPVSDWLKDPKTAEQFEAIFWANASTFGGPKRMAQLRVRDERYCDSINHRDCADKLHKLHPRDAALWLLERLREMNP